MTQSLLYLCSNADIIDSGWSVYTSELAGQTPCFTPTTVSAIIPTSISNSSSSASTSIINTQLFALRYSLQQSKQSSTLSTGAKAGIAVGAAGGAALALLALALFIRKRRGRARARRDEATVPGFKGPTDAHAYSHKPTPSELPSPYSQGPVSELPSPTTMRSPTPPLPDNAMWFPLRSHKPPGPPTELVGSTYINEHHPAYSPITSPTAFHAQSDGFLNEVEHKPPAELDVGKA